MVESYIVRVYRRNAVPGQEVAGLIERAGSSERMAFSSVQELWSFLCGKPVGEIPKQTRKRRTRDDF